MCMRDSARKLLWIEFVAFRGTSNWGDVSTRHSNDKFLVHMRKIKCVVSLVLGSGSYLSIWWSCKKFGSNCKWKGNTWEKSSPTERTVRMQSNKLGELMAPCSPVRSIQRVILGWTTVGFFRAFFTPVSHYYYFILFTLIHSGKSCISSCQGKKEG